MCSSDLFALLPPSVTASELKPRYLKFIRALKALPSKPSVLIIGEYKGGSEVSDEFKSPWSSYVKVVKAVAEQTDSAYTSIADTFPTKASGARPGISTTDDLHPNDLGQRRIAKVVLAAIAADQD